MVDPTPTEPALEIFDLSEIADRALKSAAEAFTLALPTAIVFTDLPGLAVVAAAAGFGAASAAASVLLNSVLAWSRSRSSRIQL